ncbi:hypothetical protein STEG23_023187 [Scotinomys teguina]
MNFLEPRESQKDINVVIFPNRLNIMMDSGNGCVKKIELCALLEAQCIIGKTCSIAWGYCGFRSPSNKGPYCIPYFHLSRRELTIELRYKGALNIRYTLLTTCYRVIVYLTQSMQYQKGIEWYEWYPGDLKELMYLTGC